MLLTGVSARRGIAVDWQADIEEESESDPTTHAIASQA
jgi:hypothetical protein